MGSILWKGPVVVRGSQACDCSVDDVAYEVRRKTELEIIKGIRVLTPGFRIVNV
jgi:hypothetical protein